MDFQLTDSDKKRFWAKVDIKGEDECWNWIGGSIDKDGYGRIWLKNKTFKAHRVSILLYTKNVLNFLDIKSLACHTCKQNRKCVNPLHLYWGDNNTNKLDSMRDGTAAVNNFPPPPTTKLTVEQVVEIRRRYAEGNVLNRELAVEYSVAITTISCITAGTAWKHI